jgi:hypothetical protein
MVATVEIRDTNAVVTTVATVLAAGIRAAQAFSTTVYNVPTAAIRASSFVSTSLLKTTNNIRRLER